MNTSRGNSSTRASFPKSFDLLIVPSPLCSSKKLFNSKQYLPAIDATHFLLRWRRFAVIFHLSFDSDAFLGRHYEPIYIKVVTEVIERKHLSSSIGAAAVQPTVTLLASKIPAIADALLRIRDRLLLKFVLPVFSLTLTVAPAIDLSSILDRLLIGGTHGFCWFI